MSDATGTWRGGPSRGVKRALRALVYVGFVLAVSGCVPIGVRVQNMFA